DVWHLLPDPPGSRCRPATRIWHTWDVRTIFRRAARMYVFLPSTIPALARLLEKGRSEEASSTAFVADPEPGGDGEEAGYQAMCAAAEESLAVLAADADAPRRRVVLVAILPGDLVGHEGRAGEGVARVKLAGGVAYTKLAGAHVGDAGGVADITVAARQRTSDAARVHELMWFAVQEL